jgi:hypothetical protein
MVKVFTRRSRNYKLVNIDSSFAQEKTEPSIVGDPVFSEPSLRDFRFLSLRQPASGEPDSPPDGDRWCKEMERRCGDDVGLRCRDRDALHPEPSQLKHSERTSDGCLFADMNVAEPQRSSTLFLLALLVAKYEAATHIHHASVWLDQEKYLQSTL